MTTQFDISFGFVVGMFRQLISLFNNLTFAGFTFTTILIGYPIMKITMKKFTGVGEK